MTVETPAALAELTYPEAEALRARGAVVLLPIGSTEAHGPHLPLGTDVIISDELARRVARALGAGGTAAVIAPAVAYALTDCALPFTGTVSLPAATALALVGGVCRDLQRQGFPRVCLVSSHLEPAHVQVMRQVADAARVEGRPVAFPDATEPRWARTLSPEFKRGACHAGSYETALVLAARPELVRDEVRARLPPVEVDLPRALRAGARTFVDAGGPDAYFGDPARATAAEGEALYARLVEMVVAVIAETWPAGGAGPLPGTR
jgi:creatinine amidohydrolase